MENTGVIKRIEGANAFVEVDPVASGCGRCHEEGGCGSGLLSQSLRPAKFRLYRLPNHLDAKVGDRVILSVPDGAVLHASLWAYMLPIIMLITGAAVGTVLTGRDSAALFGAVAGLGLGLLFLRKTQHRMTHRTDVIAQLHMRFDDGRPLGCKSQGE